MGAAYFYHLTRKPLEATLPLLLGKALGAGWRCQVIGGGEAQRRALDTSLWLGDEAEFLPHGIEGGPNDAEQPILLCAEVHSGHDAQCLMLIDGALVDPEVVKAKDRICILFDGNDEAAVAAARTQWRSLTDAGCAAQYWSEETGSWIKKAEKAAD
ncbi:MAG: DNA polymerase III subunit chi [Pseudomonadota bacterium]